MANTEWNIPFELKSPQGTITLGADSGNRYVLIPSKCYMKQSKIRVSEDDVPQGDGGIDHDNWLSFYECKITVQYWIGDSVASSVIACGSDRRQMDDDLMLHLAALVRPTQADADAGNAQLIWTPSGDSSIDDRMLHRIKLVDFSEPVDDGEGAVEVSFLFHSPYPYAMDKTELTASQSGAGIFTVTNPGTTLFYPVFKVHGGGTPMTDFQLANNTTGEEIIYSDVFPGAQNIPSGSYAELSSFRQTIYMNGNGANLKPCIDSEVTDFWGLVPGDNEIEFVPILGGSVDVLYQAAWF